MNKITAGRMLHMPVLVGINVQRGPPTRGSKTDTGTTDPTAAPRVSARSRAHSLMFPTDAWERLVLYAIQLPSIPSREADSRVLICEVIVY